MISLDEMSKLTETQKEIILLNLVNKVHELEMKVIKMNVGRIQEKWETQNKPEKTETEEKTFPPVDDAPVWEVWFKVETSAGIRQSTFETKAWTEKQAAYLARVDKLFPTMSEFVKGKVIEPKWKILDVVATKKDA
jgi:hypothetical protein